MALSLSLRGTSCLLAALLVVTHGGANGNVYEASVEPAVTAPDAPDHPATDYSGHGPVSGDPHQENPSVFVTMILQAIRAERDGAIKAAVASLLTTQTRQQEKLDSVADELKDQNIEMARVADSASTLGETILDSVRQELDGIHSSFERWLEPFAEHVQSRLDAMDSRLESMDSRLNASESRLDSEDHGPDRTGADLPRDCSDLPSGSPSGSYSLQPDRDHSQPPVSSVCDMETGGGGWTVFQRRDEALPQQDFFLDWAAYKEGFGDPTSEFWWGLESLWKLTSAPDRRYELRIDLYDFDGDHLHADYREFGVSFEDDGYRLLGGHYTGGGAGDSLADHFGHRFSTKDIDNDAATSHCARTRKGGWWYHACHDANLNGPYLAGRTPKDVYGVNWPTWRGWRYSLRKVEMKIRPKNDDY